MSEINCPICQRPNDAKAERCWYCHALLSIGSKTNKPNNTDFLQNLRDESEKSSQPFSAEETQPNDPSEGTEEEVPNWLARIRAREQQEHNHQPQPQPIEPEPITAAKDEIPDWLKEIKAGNSGKKLTTADTSDAALEDQEKQEPAQTATNRDDTEEWLKHLAAWKPQVDKVDQTENKTQPHIQLNPLTQSENPPKEPQGLNLFEGWQKISPEPIAQFPEKSDSSDQFNENMPDSETDDFDVELLRNNLDESIEVIAEEAVDNQSAPFIVSEPTPIETKEQVFDLDEPVAIENPIGDVNPFTQDLPDISPFLNDDLPDWLENTTITSRSSQRDEPVSEEITRQQIESQLEKGNLPAWLQSMRPSPTKVTDEIESSETQGMLAGIAGTLPGITTGEIQRKPVGFGTALKVSERQKNNAAILASLIEEPLETDDSDLVKTNQVTIIAGRILLALVLVAILLFANRLPATWKIHPVLYPPEIVNIVNHVNSITSDKPVLLTADFEPASTGELSLSSKTVLEHLIRRGINFAILSTNPSGTAILMEQLASIGQKVPGFDITARIINLGYLPGSSIGLQLMSENLRTAVPHTFDTYDIPAAWNSDILQSVQSLSDFSTVIVFSDKAESARVWVEQLHPESTPAPLFFVISAQAAPLLEPYYQSGQIAGYLSGYLGEINYQSILSQTENSDQHLSGYQLSLLLIAFLLLAGGVFSLVHPSSTRPKK